VDTTLTLTAESVDPEQRLVEDAPERLAVLEKDPVLGVKRRFQPEVKQRTPGVGPSSSRARRLPELLPELARVYGVQLLSDAYWSAPPVAPDALDTAEPTMLFELLDRLAGTVHRWDHRGNLVRLRSRTWFFDRPREVPLRLVRRWKELSDREAALPLAEYLQMAGALTDAQLDGLGSLAGEQGLPLGLPGAGSARHVLRLYGSLSPAQQQALWQGNAIPAAKMAPAQRVLFAAGLQERSRYGRPPLPPAQWAAGSLSLTSERFVLIREQRGGVRQDRLERAPIPGAPDSDPAAGRAAIPGAPLRYPIISLRVRLSGGPQAEETFPILIAAPP
jgi:hypothetical protein